MMRRPDAAMDVLQQVLLNLQIERGGAAHGRRRVLCRVMVDQLSVISSLPVSGGGFTSAGQ
nr:hypothetical protein [Halomonas socia]